MTSDAESAPRTAGGPPKRRFRNYLLDTRFQLKYTSAVVLVTVIVTSIVGVWLGSEAYSFSTGMSEMMAMERMEGAEALDEEFMAEIEADSREQDARVLRQIITGIVLLVLVLAIALGSTGIIVTHKVVGPAYKLKLQLGDVASGRLNIQGGFRKGDELQDLGEAFKDMIAALRERQEEEIAQIDEIIAEAEQGDAGDELVEKIRAVRERMQTQLDT